MKSRKIEKEAMELNQERLQKVLRKNRLTEEFMEELSEVYQHMSAQLDFEIYVERVEFTGYAVITLGDKIDGIHEEYMQKGEMLKAYLLDCLALEILENIYQVVPDIFLKENQFYVKQFQFPGDQIPLEEIRTIFQICKPEKISYNDSYMLKPLKSVAFLAELSTEKSNTEYTMCQQCSNKNCLSRDYKLCK